MARSLVDFQRIWVNYDVVADVELVVHVHDLRYRPLNAALSGAYPPVSRLRILCLLLCRKGPRRHYSLNMYKVLVCFCAEVVDV